MTSAKSHLVRVLIEFSWQTVPRSWSIDGESSPGARDHEKLTDSELRCKLATHEQT